MGDALNSKILKLAIPNIVTNLTIPLLGMVDLGLMGHTGSRLYVGAIALGTMIFSFIFWGFGFLRMGSSGFAAQAYGARDLEEATKVLLRSLALGACAGVLLILLQYPIDLLAFSLIGGSAEVEALAREYFYIRIYAAPATLCLYAITGWFIGMQNARSPMIIAISVNLLNIAFSLYFIKISGMHSSGIALANVLSQCTGILIAIALFIRYYSRLGKFMNLRKALKGKAVLNFLHVNSDIFIRTLCLIFTLSFFTTKSAKEGDLVLAVNTLLFQFLYLFSYFIDGFAYAAEAIVGKAIGAGNRASLKHLVRRLFLWGLSIALFFTLFYLGGRNIILNLLTDNQDVIKAASPYIGWVLLIPLLTFPAFIWDGIYVGATASKAMRNSMLLSTLLLFLPAYYLLNGLLGNHALWIAIFLFMAGRGITLSLFSRGRIIV